MSISYGMKKKYKIVFLLIAFLSGHFIGLSQTKRAAVETVNNAIAKTMATNTANVSYMENKGQWFNKVLYQGDFFGGRVFLEKNALTYVFLPPGGIERLHPHPGANKADFKKCTMTFQAVRMEFLGCNPASIEPADKRSYYCNYFIGNDASKWASNVGAFGSVYYNNLYPGVSVKVFSDQSNVRYDFILDPHTNVSEIKLQYEGQNGLSLNEGKLIIHTEIGDIAQSQPIAYQEINGSRVNVDCHFVLHDNVLGFELGNNYDPTQPLVIDPTLVFSTFSGSTADNWGMSATYDAMSNAYTSGICFAIGYPVTPGAYMMTFQGGGTGGGNLWPPPDNTGFDIVISKFNPTGTGLLFSTYLGGSDNEEPQSLVVDNQDNLVVLGRTYSTNFPTTPGAFQAANGGGADLIVSKFDSSGTQLMASTYVGGSGDDGVNISALEDSLGSLKHNYADDGRGDVVVDINNNVYVASCTSSPNFPTTAGAFQAGPQGKQDGCAFKMNANLTAMVWSTYLGGAANDAAYNIALNSADEAYVAGGTESGNFPATAGTLNPFYMGNIDGFLVHLSPAGNMLQSTFLGTTGYDQAYFVQTDKNNNVYVYGQTSGAYPITPASVYSNPNSGQFIHEMNPTLSATVFSTEFGSGRGFSDIAPSAFLVDNCDNIYISGWGGDLYLYNGTTSSTIGLPTTPGAYRTTPNVCNNYYTKYQNNGEDFYFAVFQKNASSLWYATFFGATSGGYPTGSLAHVDGGTSRFDKRGVIYQAICGGCGGYSDIPTTTGAWSATNDGPNCNNALVKFEMNLLETVASFVISPAVTVGCSPFTITFKNTTSYGKTYSWNFGDGGTSTSPTPTHIYATPGTYRIELTAVDSTTCNLVDSAFAIVRIVAPPVVTAPSTFVCLGDSVQLNATSAGALSFTWTPNTGLNNSSISNPRSAPLASTAYYVTVADSFCSTTDTVNVAVYSNQTKIIPGNAQICLGDSVKLTTDSSYVSYVWSTGTTASFTEVKTAGPVYVVTTDKHGCKGKDSVEVQAYSKVPLFERDTAICLTHIVHLYADSGDFTYLWEPPFSLNKNNIFNPVAAPIVTTVYTVTVTNGPCVTTDSVKITVKPTPVVQAVPDSIMVLPGQTVTLNAVGTPPFTWSPAKGLSCTDCDYPTVVVDSNTMYYVQVADSDGCSAMDSVILDVIPTMYVPNAFTPNHDGLNDVFRPVFTGYISIEVWIFDRWGTEIYHWTTLDGGWDGTVNGDKVQEDTYVYMIKAESYTHKNFQQIGRVTVIR